MARGKFRFRMYEDLAAAMPRILDEAQEVAADLGLVKGGQAAEQSWPNPMSTFQEPHSRTAQQESPNGLGNGTDQVRDQVTKLRLLVKEAYGDAYDACPVASTTIGLALCKTVAIPSCTGRVFRRPAVMLVPRMKPSAMLANCFPIPPKYGTLFEPKPTNDAMGCRPHAEGAHPLAAIVPLDGATYAYHGIVPGQISMIAGAVPDSSLEAVAAAAEANLPYLAAVFAMGTGVPGCGFTSANDDGLPELHAGLGEVAAEYDVPFIVDNSPAIPFLGPDLSKALVSSVVFGPCGPGRVGFVIGTDEILMPILAMAGITGAGSSQTAPSGSGNSANPQAARSSSGGIDPRMAQLTCSEGAPLNRILPTPEDLTELVRALTEVRENTERYARLVSRAYDIVTSEFAHLDDGLKTALRFRKNYATLSVEVNYEDTWGDGLGFPIFSAADTASGTHLIREGLRRMGVTSVSVSEASIVIGVPRKDLASVLSPVLDQERLRLEVQALVALLRIIGRHVGYTI